MRVELPGQTRVVKKVLPRGLLGRSLLILFLPIVLVLAVALQIFYGSHLNLVSRRLAASVGGDIGMTVRLLERYPDAAERDWSMHMAGDRFGLGVSFAPGARIDAPDAERAPKEHNTDLITALRENLTHPFRVERAPDGQALRIRVQLDDGELDFDVPLKRLGTGTLLLFLVWVSGTGFVLFGIAALFMRNQVRAIRRLAGAAEAFGMGRDRGPIKPEGAVEVRRAATAFNRMQERIRRFLQQRTEMLAGVSHDLRTPLTRLRLALAVLPVHEDTREDIAAMHGDIEEMERLIESYLAFARGEGVEQARPTDLAAVLEGVAAGARRAGADVSLRTPSELVLPLRADAVRRAITNLVDNARRHGQRIALSAARLGERNVQVLIDDDGPGIPEDLREEMFSPFARGEAGGSGLGLTIARDIVRAHGGDIVLENSPLGGLRARVQLPL